MDKNLIICDTDKCTGCRICEYVCSVVKENQINPRLARVRTIRVDPVFDLALTCRKCDNPACLDQCARAAISQNEETAQIIIDPDKCDGCGMCVKACHFGILTVGIDNKITFVCDFCKDQEQGPMCVEYCPKNALEYLPLDEIEDKKPQLFHQILQESGDKK